MKKKLICTISILVLAAALCSGCSTAPFKITDSFASYYAKNKEDDKDKNHCPDAGFDGNTISCYCCRKLYVVARPDRQGSDKQRLGFVGALDKDGFGNGTCKSKQLFINVEFGDSLPQSRQTG